MASSATCFARIFLFLLCVASVPTPSTAQQAADRCEGTLCDFYYGNKTQQGAQPAAPAGATPLTVPKGNFLTNMFGGGSQQADAQPPGTPAPVAHPMVQVGGGGVIGMARGAPQERCGGSLCDLFYGGPSPEEQREAHQGQNPDMPQPARTSLAPGAGPALDDEPRAPRRRGSPREREGVDYAREPTERPGCVAPSGDPWRCYRK